MLQDDDATCLDNLSSLLAQLLPRHDATPPRVLWLCVQVALHGTDAQVDQLLSLPGLAARQWEDAGVRWSEHEAPQQQLDRALREIVTRLRRGGPQPVPPAPSGAQGARLALRSTWLLEAAEHWAQTHSMPDRSVAPRDSQGKHCRLHMLLVDPKTGMGRVALITLHRLHHAKAHLQFVAAPSSAVTPCSASFQQAMDEVTAWLRTQVRDANAFDTVLAWDVAPVDAALWALDGASAGAALAVGAAWLLKDLLPAGPLRSDLQRIQRADLLDAHITAAIDVSGALLPVGHVLGKGEALKAYCRSRKTSVRVFVSNQQDLQAADLDDSHIAVDPHAHLHGLVEALAQRCQPLTPEQRSLLEAVLAGDPDDDQPPELDDEAILLTVADGPVRTLVDYALQRWAWWARKLAGQVHSRFVPLVVTPDNAGLPPGLGLSTGPHKGLQQLLAENDRTKVHGFMLRGQPGAGKSTLLQHHEQALCRQALRDWDAGKGMAELPLYLPLSGLAHDAEPLKWVQATAREDYPDCHPLHQLLDPARRQPADPRLRCMLDGLNELPVLSADQRRQRAQQVAAALWRGLRPGVPMLLGARTHHGFDFSQGSEALYVVPVDLMEWSDEDIQHYLGRRFTSEQATAHWQALESNSPALALCRVPINLSGQCDLLAAGVTRLVSDRADLYRRWLWQRLQRELATRRGRAVNPVLYDDRLLSPDDRETLLTPGILQQSELPPWPSQGQLLPSLFRQGLAQWRQSAALKPELPASARGEVEVPWDGKADALPGDDTAHGVVHWLDPDLRLRWREAAQALGLGELSRDRRRFKWRHQSWGEYLASVHLLPPTPEQMPEVERTRLLQDLQPPALERRDVDELAHQRQLVVDRWGRVDPAFWQGLLDEGITLPRDEVQEALRKSGWFPWDFGLGGIWSAFVDAGILIEQVENNLCRVELGRWGDALKLDAVVGAPAGKWRERPEGWQVLVVEKLWIPFEREIWRRLGDEEAGELQAQVGRLQTPPAGDLDEVLGLALLGLDDPVPWMADLVAHGLWRPASGALPALARRLEPDGPWTGPERRGPHPVLQHLRRVLLLLSVDAGAGVRQRLVAGGVTKALEQPVTGLSVALQAHWQREQVEAFLGDSHDVRERLQAGLLLGELGDNLRYERVCVDVPGQDARTGLRLRQAHWVGLGKLHEKRWYRIGSDADDELARTNEKPAFEVELNYFEMAAYPVTVGEWRAFVEGGGYRDPRAPWWVEAGVAAQAWLRHRLDERKGRLLVPWGWDNAEFNNPLQPMTGICAYEAQAYACWAAPLYGAWPDGLHLQVPTEAMWEAGVRGPLASRHARTTQQRWPHEEAGRAPDALLFNHFNTRWALPTTVGVFSQGLTALGVSDAAGNVWEWCSNAVDDDAAKDYRGDARQRAAQVPARGDDDLTHRALRGGGFNGSSAYCRVACRLRRRPGYDVNDNGVRLVRCVLPHSEP